jgi:hypothetical protein
MSCLELSMPGKSPDHLRRCRSNVLELAASGQTVVPQVGNQNTGLVNHWAGELEP